MPKRGTLDLDFKEPAHKKARFDKEVLGEEEDEESDEDGESSDDGGEGESVSNPTRNFDIFRQREKGAGELYVSIGKSRRGKTHFTRCLLADQISRPDNPLKFGIVFVKTKFKHSYQDLEKKGLAKVYQGYNEEVLKTFINNLEEVYKSTGSIPANYVVFEDLVGILNNQSQWFINWISTYRHFNTSVFINVQYLLGRGAISPIMREQTSFAIIFNSKCNRTIKNLYENYGQLFEKEAQFKQYYFANTGPKNVGDYVCMVYVEDNDDVNENYIPMRAPPKPAQIPDRTDEQQGPPEQQGGLTRGQRTSVKEELERSIRKIDINGQARKERLNKRKS